MMIVNICWPRLSQAYCNLSPVPLDWVVEGHPVLLIGWIPAFPRPCGQLRAPVALLDITVGRPDDRRCWALTPFITGIALDR